MLALRLSAYTLTSALGAGLAPHADALRRQRGGIVRKQWETIDFAFCMGEVAGLDATAIRSDLARFDCRNNRLAQYALEQDGFAERVREAVGRYGPDRVAVLLGSSTSGILSSEIAYRHRDPASGRLPGDHRYRETHNAYSVADFVRHYFDLAGPACVISTACSSSAKVFGAAERLIALGLVDAAIVGGVDSLCLTTVYGFSSLQLVSPNPCRPFDADRDGISIGEGAAYALLERPHDARPGSILLTGVGETSDAYHMSSPHPEGLGARAAMTAALQCAGLTAGDIDYINLHGTATPSNDAAEDAAVSAVFGTRLPCSSTKGHTGHTLGAAGGIEAILCAIVLDGGFLPGGVGTEHLDPRLKSHYLLATEERPLRHVLSNSFGFGGSNCSLIFSREAA
ncbi:MAG: beta-ketoacyl-[acyl-carrier-protein] synthase family protein [Paludibacterium sp.]|uniref:beta-ketoacyl-[acyl-carrier-protein] synthase family protein n=1 Tax=Paludibacterium sp. TaxID=1917523 RepID=UPI0025FDCC17|nr:beta-ketoacyl-[acyl-carrier-protein] synthase family protein [Paludibacterium sp.]MBV8047874.1 beta-ketoacyl-[acyl-carrier-protein] synthase family protein [Paludibacterium sp.]MBV8649747.1 beta-ketoacyl-[acyl-carrier-protein] synthase family protein [Paludibacterium sp.]